MAMMSIAHTHVVDVSKPDQRSRTKSPATIVRYLDCLLYQKTIQICQFTVNDVSRADQ